MTCRQSSLRPLCWIFPSWGRHQKYCPSPEQTFCLPRYVRCNQSSHSLLSRISTAVNVPSQRPSPIFSRCIMSNTDAFYRTLLSVKAKSSAAYCRALKAICYYPDRIIRSACSSSNDRLFFGRGAGCYRFSIRSILSGSVKDQLLLVANFFD